LLFIIAYLLLLFITCCASTQLIAVNELLVHHCLFTIACSPLLVHLLIIAQATDLKPKTGKGDPHGKKYIKGNRV
jgi:hypothetical protein